VVVGAFRDVFLVFGRAGILGFLVADYALLWFRLFMMCLFVTREFVPCFVYAFSTCRLLSWFAAGIMLVVLGFCCSVF